MIVLQEAVNKQEMLDKKDKVLLYVADAGLPFYNITSCRIVFAWMNSTIVHETEKKRAQ